MYDFNFADIFILARKHLRTVLVSGLVGLVVIGAVTVFFIPQKWTARATIAVGNQATGTSVVSGMLSSALGGIGMGSLAGLGGQGPTTDLYTLLLSSWDMRKAVVEKCGLQEVFGEKIKEAAIDDLGEAALVDATPPASCGVAVTLMGTPRGLAPGAGKDLEVRKLTVACVNAYTDTLKAKLDALQMSPSKSNRIFLEKQMPQAKAKFEKAQAALAKWQAKNHIPAPTTAGTILAQELQTVVQAQVAARVQAQADARSITEGQRLLREQKEMVIGSSSETLNPQVTALTNSLATVEQQLAQQTIFYHKTSAHPDVQQLEIQKQELMKQLAAAYKQQMLPAGRVMTRNPVYDTVRGGVVTAQVDKASADAKVCGLQAALNEGKREVEKLANFGLEYAKLWEEVVLTQAVYETITKNYQAALLGEKAEEPIFFVVDPPVVPYKKTSPSTMLTCALGMIMGMMGGVVLAFRKERRGRAEGGLEKSTSV